MRKLTFKGLCLLAGVVVLIGGYLGWRAVQRENKLLEELWSNFQ